MTGFYYKIYEVKNLCGVFVCVFWTKQKCKEKVQPGAGVHVADNGRCKSSPIPSRRVKGTFWSGAKQLILSLWLRGALVIQISHDKFTSKGWNPAPPSMPMVGWWTGRCFVSNIRWHRSAGSAGGGGWRYHLLYFVEFSGSQTFIWDKTRRWKRTKLSAWDKWGAQMFRNKMQELFF